jgi:tRNA-specific 2-thiouridylase
MLSGWRTPLARRMLETSGFPMTIAASHAEVSADAVLHAVRAAVRLPAGSRIAVAMSGGVDSSTVAGLLVEAGYQVFGLTARLYDVDLQAERKSGTCCAPEDARDARSVSQRLGIRHYVLDEREVFRTEVIDRFVQAYDAGDTPNPCVECNRSLKFDRLVGMARALGAEALATGHYARLDLDDRGQPALRRAVDTTKDQAYFLHPLGTGAADYVRFPLGALTKTQVRDHATRLGLPTAAKRESMDVCFVGSQTAQAFVEKQVGSRPGPLVDLAGTRLGQHAGVAGFTVGQRHGLPHFPASIQGDASPRYVLDKRADGTVVVGGREDLRVGELTLDGCTFVSGIAPEPGTPLAIQVRHRATPIAAVITELCDDKLTVRVHGELHAAGRGQSGVLWDGDRVLGGGRIASVSTQVRGRDNLDVPR